MNLDHVVLASNAIAVFSSSRRDGNTGRLMDRIAGELHIDIVDLAEKNISAYDYEHRNRGDAFEPLIEHVLGFEQVIFASPVYWYAVTPPMKAFLDRITDLLDLAELLDVARELRNKRAYVVCTSIYDEVPSPFIAAFQVTFNYLGMQFGGCLHANCRDGYAPERFEQDIKKFIAAIKSANET